MISNYYPSNRTSPFTVYQPSQVTSNYSPTEMARAKARNLDVIEYRRRVALVANEIRDVFLAVGDTVYPVQSGPAKKYGKCVIHGIVKHYDDYGDVEWNEPPFLLNVVSLDKPNETINCSVGYVTKREPENVC